MIWMAGGKGRRVDGHGDDVECVDRTVGSDGWYTLMVG